MGARNENLGYLFFRIWTLSNWVIYCFYLFSNGFRFLFRVMKKIPKEIEQIVERQNWKLRIQHERLLLRYRKLNAEHYARHGKGSRFFQAKINKLVKLLDAP